MEYTVIEIRGDYAVLQNSEGIENIVALAFMPEGICDGDRVATENGFEYVIVKR